MSTGTAESFHPEVAGGASRLGVYGTAIGIASGLCGAVLLVAACFSVGDDAGDAAIMTVLAAVLAGFAGLQSRRPFDARSLRPVPTLAATTVAYVFVSAVSTVVYLATGAIDRVDDALYESVTGVSTSSLTLFDDPAVLSDGELIWRAGTQWIGGGAALALAIGILPFLGGSRELADPRQRSARRLALAPKPIPALKRVAALYCLVTGVVTVALFVAGMSFFDAVAHALSSVSTGGFSTHADGIGHFDSLTIDLVMIVVMAGAGFSLALVWMLSRGQFHDTRRVFELRVYAVVLVVTSAWVFWLHGSTTEDTSDRLVESVFTTVSLSTTTGHRTADWALWDPGAAMMLIVLFVIGGMAGSVAGGLRWFRVIGLAQFVWRELQRQLHPRAVRSVKVGHAPISEESVDRWHSQLVFTIFLAGTGAIVLAFFGSDIVEALTLAFSAVSTTGPAIGDGGTTIVTAADLSRSDRAALMPLALMGRVAIYPALVLLGVVWFGAQRRVSALRFRRGRVRR